MPRFLVTGEIRVYVGEFEIEAKNVDDAEKRLRDEWSFVEIENYIESWEWDDIEVSDET